MSLANDCRSCGAPLGRGASKCRCGWTATATEQTAHVDCFNAPHCTRRAQIRTDRYSGTKGLFQNWCLKCDEREHQKNAEKWCMEQGLVTERQRIDFCRAMAKKMFRGVRFAEHREREPGDDDERIAA